MDLVIRTENVEKTYVSDSIRVKAVRGVSLTVRSGEFTALVGPSGSGKTTLLNLISGLDSPTAGKVFLKEVDLTQIDDRTRSLLRRDHIGFIFQAYNLIPVLTVYENIEYVMLLQGVDKEERLERVKAILCDVGLDGLENRYPPQISGGQQQRVAIARAVVSRPDLVLADEPTANLDSRNGKSLLDMMHDLNRKTGITFLFSTHDPMIMERANRLVILKDGMIDDDIVR
ncbi:MAG TPA: ABC transporter ATP-binding protein [Firmicutes bacterium]|nr:ABC transporter ATP-binding protein [Bacillota bacterium]